MRSSPLEPWRYEPHRDDRPPETRARPAYGEGARATPGDPQRLDQLALDVFELHPPRTREPENRERPRPSV